MIESMPQEVEASLVLVGGDPRHLRQELGALKELGVYHLEKRASVVIRDAYLDTPNSDLLGRRLSLRLRVMNGMPRITLKGDTPKSERFLKVRTELELNWTRESLEQVFSLLSDQEIRLAIPEIDWCDAEPLTALGACGLTVIQERATERMLCDVMGDNGSEPLAEMAIDAVTYHLQRRILHDEVEIELKGGRDPALIRQLIDLLRDRYPGQLERWSIAKLTLGMLLERLAESGQLKALLTQDGRLSRAAYGALRSAAMGAGLP